MAVRHHQRRRVEHHRIDLRSRGPVIEAPDAVFLIDQHKRVAVEEPSGRRVAFERREIIPKPRLVVQVFLVAGEEFPDGGVRTQSGGIRL